MVEFRALYRGSSGLGVLHERSRFVFENGCWFYVDGELLESGALLSGKIGRNESCPCGSGNKYKKCCLK
jgi:SEC-C motif-containing protein